MAARSSSSPRPCSAETGSAPRAPARDALVVRLLVAEIRLVDDEDHGLAALPQALRDAVVERRDAVEAVDDEEDERRGVDREPHLASEAAMSRGEVSPPLRPRPPVSRSVYPPSSTSAEMTSRVTPGWSWTMEIRLRASRLKSRLLPTLGGLRWTTERNMAPPAFTNRSIRSQASVSCS
jgi:hypothetical protein